MENFRELKDLVKKRGYGTAYYSNVNGEPVYLSRGVRELFFEEEGIRKIIEAVGDFQNGIYGNAEALGRQETKGHEYGHYEICALAGEDGEDTGVWVHRDDAAVIVYFGFER